MYGCKRNLHALCFGIRTNSGDGKRAIRTEIHVRCIIAGVVHDVHRTAGLSVGQQNDRRGRHKVYFFSSRRDGKCAEDGFAVSRRDGKCTEDGFAVSRREGGH